MIYLDLDGVFADYRGSFAKILGRDYHEDPEWAWSFLEQEQELYRKLSLLPGALDLLQSIGRAAAAAGERMTFLTALPLRTGYLATAAEDKVWWVRHVLLSDLPVICVAHWKEKKTYAGPSNVLIDDSARNIVEWQESGGVGILHTTPSLTMQRLDKVLAERAGNTLL